MYIPPIAVNPSSIEYPQIRLLLIGRPGTGKTYRVVTTFPNVVVADFDNGLTNRETRMAAKAILPFHDLEWVKKSFQAKNPRDAFKLWLNTDARKLEKDQTLFVDSLSALADEFHRQTEPETPISPKTKEPDGYYIWGEKLKYFRDIHAIFKMLRCHVVVAAHIRELRDEKTGTLLAKYTPLFTGQFSENMGSHFTDIYRSGVDKDGNYLWQVKSDDSYDLKSRAVYDTKFVPADFKSFKY